MIFVGYAFAGVFALLCVTAAASALWAVFFSILMVFNLTESESVFSKRTLWNPMNVIFSPELLSDKGKCFRKRALCGLVIFAISMLLGGAMGVMIIVLQKAM